MTQLARLLIGAGVLLVLAGVGLLLVERLGLGKLPGDLTVRGKNVTFHFPIVTSLVVSVVVTLLLNLWFRNR